MAANLARDLAEIAPPTQMRGLGDDDDEPIPDNDLRAMLTEQTPGRPDEIKPQITSREPTPTHATLSRELSAFKSMIGDSTHVEISRENDIGQQVIVGQYRPRDIQPYGTLTNFVLKVLAKDKGGVFHVVGTSANSKKYELETVRIDPPAEDIRQRGMDDMNRDLLARTDRLTDLLLEAKSVRPQEQPNIVETMRQLDELKKSSGGDNGLMMALLMQQSQNRGPDPAVAALGNAMTALAAKLERIEERAMQAPLPAGPPPGPSGEMLLILELIKNMGQKESPTDTFLKMAALLKPPPAPDPLETLVRLKELSKSSDNSPLKERMEELMLLKKLSGNDNPFGDILKTFMTSPLGAGLGNGLGAAIRKSNEPVAPPPAALPAPSTAPPDFPAGYLEMFQKQINEAKDDAELVEAVVGSLFMLGGDANWQRFAGAFMSATVADDLVKVNEMLKVLFNVWAEKGATITREKLDTAIRAVNTSWDIIVQKVCEAMKAPLPASHAARTAAKNAPPPAPETPRPVVSLVPPLAPEPAPVA